ncbi:MAG: endonuclease/exonuclease/phosphatase family protein [Rhodothermales bacterium]|nr:endonuclease/exonuclease/phosphatase family protein [Rhodothermales bacterium]
MRGLLLLAVGFSLTACAPDIDAVPAAPATDLPLPPPPDSALRVMSYNVRFATPDDGADAWPYRREALAAVIEAHRPDLIGMQEPLEEQVDWLAGRLGGYGWVGRGRGTSPGAGEFSPVFYRTDRLRLLEEGTFWLSARPEQAGSRHWDAFYPRIATWARFADRATGDTLVHLNTHFDHVGPFAKRRSADLVLDRLEDLADGAPAVVTGDLNAHPGSAPYRILTQSARRALRDARLAAEQARHGPEGTFTGFGAPPERAPRIDYVLVSRGVRVLRYAVLPDRPGGRAPSDHRPVVADLVLPD